MNVMMNAKRLVLVLSKDDGQLTSRGYFSDVTAPSLNIELRESAGPTDGGHLRGVDQTKGHAGNRHLGLGLLSLGSISRS